MTSPRLITIPISHYCERARWALTYAGVAFQEDRHLQRFHRKALAPYSLKTVPVLVDGDDVVADSCSIVEYASRRVPSLYPEDVGGEVRQWEEKVVGDFGVEVRRLAYAELLPHPAFLHRYNSTGAPLWQRASFRMMYPFVASKVAAYLRVTEEKVEEGLQLIDSTLDAIEDQLGGREYLVGSSFTAADLTFCALAAPLVFPQNYGVPLPTPEASPASLRAKIEGFRGREAGQYVLRTYERHRTQVHGSPGAAAN